MRALWRGFGKPGGSVSGAVDRPYTLSDARRVLAEVAHDADFADDFFDRFIDGHEVVDYASLLANAGLVLRQASPGQPTLGGVRLGAGMVVAELTPYGSPLHDAGVNRDDILTMLDGQRISSARDLARIVQGKRPGDRLAIGFQPTRSQGRVYRGARRGLARRTGACRVVRSRSHSSAGSLPQRLVGEPTIASVRPRCSPALA